MNVRDLLKTKGALVVSAVETDRVSLVLNLFTSHQIGAVPVLSTNGVIAGLLAERDVIQALARKGPSALALEARVLMKRPAPTCSPDTPVRDVMKRMTELRLRHLLVVEDGRLAGIVSIGDVVKHQLQEMKMEADVLRDFITVTRVVASGPPARRHGRQV